MENKTQKKIGRARRPRQASILGQSPRKAFIRSILGTGLILALLSPVFSMTQSQDQSLDEKIQAFLASHRHNWRDMNVPESDGKILYELILENNYTKALEIGTSTGHSGIWIAWALSKTGGKLVTVENDERRYRQALENFEEAGLTEYIDARLANAHDLVPQLKGPFDFVFCDADKGWYKKYLIAVLPKLEVGGCFTAHNVSGRRQRGIGDFLEYLEGLPNIETTIDSSSWSGISISYKRFEK
jgi:predicted O-methyltransferase YrrM